ncbi:hypothetical protein ACJX0J_023300, partial [Zea mays]
MNIQRLAVLVILLFIQWATREREGEGEQKNIRNLDTSWICGIWSKHALESGRLREMDRLGQTQLQKYEHVRVALFILKILDNCFRLGVRDLSKPYKRFITVI